MRRRTNNKRLVNDDDVKDLPVLLASYLDWQPQRGVALLLPLTFCICEPKDSQKADAFSLISSQTGFREGDNGKEKAAVSLN